MAAPRSSADYLAIDLGASSGRAVLGSFDGERLAIRELHRFPNGPIQLATGLHWDVDHLFGEIKRALSLAAATSPALGGIGLDTWGVDYGLLSETGELVAPPHHYRDPRTHGLMDAAFARIPRERIYRRTGIQFMPPNTLYQLLADQSAGRLRTVKSLLFMPDLLHFWLTGVQRSERTIASTSQLFDTGAGEWAMDLVNALGLPAAILPTVAAPGTPVGPLLPAIASETGLRSATIIAPASHDTASAVAAVPARGQDWAYISSGTWSLVGRELRAPIRTPSALAANFTNECGVAPAGSPGAIRFHKNIAGLWLLQECQRIWTEQGRTYTFDDLCTLSLSAPPLAALFDPDEPSLAEFGDMPSRIRDLCSRSGQTPPDSDGAIARAILESLALKCRLVIDTLESLTLPIHAIHIIGGGARNTPLCEFTANACARPILAGPIEATAIGNILTQALAHNRVKSLADIRAVVGASFTPTRYDPRDAPAWTAALDRFRKIAR